MIHIFLQVREAVNIAISHNAHFLSALKCPKMTKELLDAKPPSYSSGSVEEAALTMKRLWPIWQAMEGVKEILDMVPYARTSL